MNIFTRFCATIGAETKFEKARIAATYSNTTPPCEEDIYQILQTLSGDDIQTDSRTGFGSIVRRLKLQNNDEDGWILIIKTLIIIDRCVSDRILLNEFAELDLPYVECRQERSQKNKQLLLNELISKYYHYIKFKCLKLKASSFSLMLYKKEKLMYFNQLSTDKIFAELHMILQLVQKAFEVVETKKNGHLRFKVNQYVFLLLMNDLTKYYGCSLIGFNQLLKKLQDLKLDELLQLAAISNLMYDFSTKFEEFIHQCRFIQGFENMELDYKFDHQSQNLISQYVDSYEKKQQNGIYQKKIKLHRYTTEAMLKSIFQQTLTEKQSEYFGNLMIQQPSRIELYCNQFKHQFVEQTYQSLNNNYSTKYTPIHENFKRVPEPIINGDIDFLQQLEDDQSKFAIKDFIEFQYPEAFNEKMFTSFNNNFHQ